MLNRVILIGRLTRDPELRYTASGVAMTTFTLAVDRNFVNQQGERGTDFIRITVWRKLAETCANHLGKGRLVAVDGRLQTRTYETPDGQKRSVTDVVAEDVRFLDWPKEGRGPAGSGPVAGPGTGGGMETAGSGFNQDFSDLGTEVEIGEDDLPF
ncbi:single-stranded DNA-binding protein [Neomoorella thermoacetica]|uniref:Single-stranded DNA-binding protein n=3 Tax=Neomoorella thermoacetica TaxID=1525 RepID=A0A1D7X6V0_NEOTH|nr:single-stranded DNA-binding protein [Moorella thermoacetica]AKX92958.1 single-stranded DNA-binding protein A [Moorella thermoacetica]AKX95511.1 single-stranded DNA-binding protein A [Moorella thermoacetica]AOQ22628.1 Single-stranded DNA-binding protein ssb [Moorella thermoacetica]APC07319.1 single-stranded DNA-binding protein A [Moorella thermoacetica]OIQ10314.1 single-stranded DNA-binding protein A [Moorella thermoacetica]